MNAQITRPKSSIPALTGYLGVLAIISLTVFFPRHLINASSMDHAVLFLLAVFGFMAFYELVFAKTYRSADTGLDFKQGFSLRKILTKDFAVKMFGLFVSLVFVAVYYSVADMYQDRWYQRFFIFLQTHWQVITAIVLAYFVLVHLSMKDVKDSYWQLGAFVLSLGKLGDRPLVRDHLLALGVKMFFLPLMFCYFLDDWYYVTKFDFSWGMDFEELYRFFYRYLYFIDLIFVVIGYVFTARLFNAHIRWTERRWGGWVVCLICYMPFWQVFGRSYFNYTSDVNWMKWLWDFPFLYTLWGCVILLLSALYVLSEVHFGLRFSNLTYRGLISHGLFRFTKHPAYVSKNIAWWMMDVPFIAADWTLALRNSLALMGVNIVYFLRARYEERCLSEASEYRQYAEYIGRFGIFSKKGKKIAKK